MEDMSTMESTANSTMPLPNGSSTRAAFEIILLVNVGVGMFGVGCGVQPQRLLKHFKKPTGAVIGILSQFSKCMIKVIHSNTNRSIGILLDLLLLGLKSNR